MKREKGLLQLIGLERLRVQELVSAHACEHAGALAVSAPDGVLSYAELDRRSNQLANRLRRMGVAVETPVALCLPRSAALVVGALGILKAGGAYVALDPANPTERLAFMIDDSGAGVVVTDSPGVTRLGTGRATVTLEEGLASLDAEDSTAPAPLGGPDDLAYVVYTSGSTGLPKGVLVEHAGLLNLVTWHRRAFAITEADRGTQLASPGFDAVVWELWPLLTAGASVHVPPDALRTDPASLRDWLVEHRITTTFLPTSLAEATIALAWPPHTSLRHVLTGGDVLRNRPRAGLPFVLVNNYGPAEATVVATSGVVPALGDGAAEPATPTIGRAIDSVTLHVVDAGLRPVGVGEVGELLIGGAGVARGYLNRPQLTAERFVPDPFSTGGGRLYRSGDLVRLRADEELEFVGRVDDQVQIGGRRVELGEISVALDRHPGVGRSAVILVADGAGPARLTACAVPSDGARPDLQTLRSFLATSLPEHMIPGRLVWLAELPMTVSDKIDRSALEHLARAGEEAAGRGPRTELEVALVAIVAELLGVATVGIDDNFFLLGGHSLLGAQMIARIEERFAVEVALRDLFERPTVAGMAEEVERLLVADLDAITDEEAERLTLELQAYAGGAGS